MTPIWASPDDGDVYHAIHAGIERGIGGSLGAGQVMAVMDGEKVLGAVLFNNYQPAAGVMELHAAAISPRWLSRRIFREAFAYPFEQVGCQAVVMRADPENKPVARIARACGFKKYEIPRLRGRGQAEAVYVLSDDDWSASDLIRKELTDG